MNPRIISCLPVLLIILAFDVVTSAHAQYDICRQAAGAADLQIRVQYSNVIDHWLRVSAALQQKGVDPRRFPQANPDGTVTVLDLPTMVHSMAMQRDIAVGQIFQAYQECVYGFAPYQKIADIGMFFATAGLSQVLPPAATRVDVTSILSGTPFGGPSALIPQAREQILGRLGIGGDVAKVIRDPKCIFGC